MHITALPIVVPLMAAALLVTVRKRAPRVVLDVSSVGVGIAAVTMSALILARTAHNGPFAYWLGGWQPKHLVSLGIALSIDPIGAGLATFAALLVTAALIYSWRYFEDIDGLFHALMLVFMGAMVGFSLTGDLFDLVVFYELMSVTAFSLTAYRVESKGPIQGALNFAVSNSVGAYSIFIGVGLLYARTGALNMAQIGASLDRHATDPLVGVAMALLFAGFLTKAAAVPFHFWLADAYAVAPTPVCVLFSGIMTEFGIYAIARLYWVIFAGPMGAHAEAVRAILVAFGTLTTLWGGVMCLAQRHIKRLLAFATISHVGMFLCGVGLLSSDGLAGAGVYIIGNGLAMATLFMLSGVLIHRFGNIDEFDLHGRGKVLRVAGVLWGLGGLILSAVPVVTLFFGKSLLDGASLKAGYGWLPTVYMISSILTGGAVLRVGGRVFLGWGPAERPSDRVDRGQAHEEMQEDQASQRRTPPLMLLVPAVLLAGAVVVGLIPGAVPGIEIAAGHFVEHRAYVNWVLRGHVGFSPVATTHVEGYDYLYGAGAALGSIALAALALFGRPLLQRLPHLMVAPVAAAVVGLRRLHTGHIGDYVAWWTAGAALLGGSSLIFLR